jgi:hypothetical protein
MSFTELHELVVYDAPELRKVRLGSRWDGGYVVPADLVASVDCLYAAGVGHNLDFERDLRARSGAWIKAFDPTIARPAHLPAEIEFFPVGVGVESRSLETLLQHGRAFPAPGPRRWLKLDIEGWEWPALALTQPSCLEAFDLLIIEFHGLSDATGWAQRRRPEVLARINRSFCLIHAHGNNFAPHTFVGDTLLPDCLETTFLRADLAPKDRHPNRAPLPGPVDAPCNPHAPELPLACWPYCS